MKKSLLLCLLTPALLAGCSSMIEKAENASQERAAKFSDEELCKHLKDDGNQYYHEANVAEAKKRGLNCP